MELVCVINRKLNTQMTICCLSTDGATVYIWTYPPFAILETFESELIIHLSSTFFGFSRHFCHEIWPDRHIVPSWLTLIKYIKVTQLGNSRSPKKSISFWLFCITILIIFFVSMYFSSGLFALPFPCYISIAAAFRISVQIFTLSNKNN